MTRTIMTPQREQRLRELFSQGLWYKDISRKMGLAEHTIRGWCRKLGLKHPIPDPDLCDCGKPRHAPAEKTARSYGRICRDCLRAKRLRYKETGVWRGSVV